MYISKKVLISTFLILSSVFVFAQEQKVQSKKNSDKEEETSVESEYLTDVDGDIIMTLA